VASVPHCAARARLARTNISDILAFLLCWTPCITIITVAPLLLCSLFKKRNQMAFSNGEVALVKGMIVRGDRQSDIAAYFGVNGGRIAEINTEKYGADVRAAPTDQLPPPGPYFASGRNTIRARETLVALRDLIDQTLTEMNEWEKSSS
jgi:hypothetical protein